ncbi:L,D-transpeptidase family protein [Sphingorhabdus arenilitoris]|uniref:L,D-transpeptidase family protein n=1 Tax=Sphingorhabdus arenilitoris TaxID=1490041 RepID=A0ABV8RD96_9SPHN
MTYMTKTGLKLGMSAAAAICGLCALPALAQDESANPAQAETVQDRAGEADVPLIIPQPVYEPKWSADYATDLLAFIAAIDSEGLKPSDYRPEQLTAAIAAGEGAALDAEFVRAFTWLAEDLRDGRTPMKARVEWYVNDPDADTTPISMLLAKVKESGDVAGTLRSLEPAHPDYAALRDMLAKTPKAEISKRRLIMANMDRWRWLKRDLGKDYLHTNVPEYKVRYVVNKQQIVNYRTVVGKPGRNATPQLAEMVQGVIFNPTWTVPQSIVKGEGLGARVLANPTWARSQGYEATKGANGYVSVVQKPGPTNALGYMKLDMPNRHAIFLHDTPSRHLFRNADRALSHGCIRTENAMELAMVIALVQGDVPLDRSKQIVKSLEYTRVPVKRELPVYITYFTMASDVDGKMTNFRDIYSRDKPVLDALAAARPQRPEKIKLEDNVVTEERKL